MVIILSLLTHSTLPLIFMQSYVLHAKLIREHNTLVYFSGLLLPSGGFTMLLHIFLDLDFSPVGVLTGFRDSVSCGDGHPADESDRAHAVGHGGNVAGGVFINILFSRINSHVI